MATRTNNNLKQLSLNPLSVAKYFYEKLGERGVEQPFLQPITYLAYQEILKKENLLLFKEEFQAGEICPFLPSLRKLVDKDDKELVKLFRQMPDINDYRIVPYLEKLTKKYSDAFACEIQYKAKDNFWKRTPENQAIRI